jgi:hypothetical protein
MFCGDSEALLHVVNRSFSPDIANRNSNNEAPLEPCSLIHTINLHYILFVTLVKHSLQSSYSNTSFRFHLKYGRI